MASWKLAPAIAAGCTCVLKPAEQTASHHDGSRRLVRRIRSASRRRQYRQRHGRNRGSRSCSASRSGQIAFTASAAVGKIIVKSAADTLKRVTLELGGKSPNIFFDGADWEAAVDGALFGVFINQGEVVPLEAAFLSKRKSTPSSWMP